MVGALSAFPNMSGNVSRVSSRSARNIAESFAQRAAHFDQSRVFAHENIRDLFDAGLLSLPRASKELEGAGSLTHAQEIIGTLAGGDASTTLVLVNHYMVHAAIASRDGWPDHLAEKLEAGNRDQAALINALLAEPELGSAARGGLSGVIAAETHEGFRISGRKAYVTGIPALSWLLVRVRTDETAPRTGLFLVPAQASGVRVVPNWDHLGMRATHSHEVVLDDVLVPHDHVVILREADAREILGHVLMDWNAGLLGALYNGIARAALSWTVDFLRTRMPTNLGKPLATLHSMQDAIGEIGIALDLNDALLASYARAVDQHQAETVQRLAAVIKLQIVDGTSDLTHKLLGITGNAGLSRRNPLERCHRDALCGRIHAPHAEIVRRRAGHRILLSEDE